MDQTSIGLCKSYQQCYENLSNRSLIQVTIRVQNTDENFNLFIDNVSGPFIVASLYRNQRLINI